MPAIVLYTLSLHDALPISSVIGVIAERDSGGNITGHQVFRHLSDRNDEFPLQLSALAARSEEHTSELQSHVNLVCRLLLEKKNVFFAYFLFSFRILCQHIT